MGIDGGTHRTATCHGLAGRRNEQLKWHERPHTLPLSSTPRHPFPMRTTIAILTCLSSLAACSTYSPPTDGKRAQIRFSGNQYYAYIDTGDSCGTRQLVLKDLWGGTPLRAGQRVWIEQGIDTSGLMFAYTCKFAYSFEPEEGSSYVSEFHNDGRGCQLGVFKVSSDGSRVEVNSARREKPKSCF